MGDIIPPCGQPLHPPGWRLYWETNEAHAPKFAHAKRRKPVTGKGRTKVLLADCGSCWTKLLRTDEGVQEVLETSSLLKTDGLEFDWATGHLGRAQTRHYENELVALAKGALKLIPQEDFTIVDVGARDAKFCRFVAHRLRKLDWNQSCGSSTGFTLELLAKYSQIDYATLPPSPARIGVTCGVFGIERIFDAIVRGKSPEEGVAQFVHGVAYNVFNFAQCPEMLYLSGGLCLNECFVASLQRYTHVVPLGRFVLLEGLQERLLGH